LSCCNASCCVSSTPSTDAWPPSTSASKTRKCGRPCSLNLVCHAKSRLGRSRCAALCAEGRAWFHLRAAVGAMYFLFLSGFQRVAALHTKFVAWFVGCLAFGADHRSGSISGVGLSEVKVWHVERWHM